MSGRAAKLKTLIQEQEKTMATEKDKPLRGFAAMDAKKQREIASKGGRNVPADKRSFSQDHKLAAAAGRKGGEHSHMSRNAAKAAAPRTTRAMINATQRGTKRTTRAST